MLHLLRTKIGIPPARPKRVERARLVERVCEGMLRSCTMIVAPAGFGKTTLLADWARESDIPVTWLSLEPADRAPERFLSYLVYALQQVSPQAGQTALALLQSGRAVSDEAVLLSLLNDLEDIPADFALILDDYHSVDDPQINGIVDFLLEHRPAHMHLAMISRSAPGLSLARLRALDQIVEIGAADLRFTADEIRSFLEQVMGAQLTPQQLASLAHSTEGWAVGLQLAGLAFARQPENWPSLAGQEYIFDYLAEEVLRREAPEVQEFLKITALFDRFCLPLLEYLFAAKSETTNGDQAGQDAAETTLYSPISILSYIEHANLFLVSLDQTWHRYHSLFTDFLRKQVTPEQATPLYRTASDWFEQNGLLDEAIHYAVHAADHERAADLLEGHYRHMLQRGEQAAISEWLACLPPELLEGRPLLWLARGWASLIAFDTTQVIACIEKAERLAPPTPAGDRLRGEIQLLRFLCDIFSGRVSVTDKIAATFSLLEEQDDFLRPLLHFNLALHHVTQGWTAQAVEALSETLRLTATLKNPLVAIITHTQLGETRQLRGALGLAERAFQQAIRYAKETLGEHTVLLGMPYVSYAELLREQNRFDQAIRYAEQGIAYCQVWQPIASMDGHISLARLLAAQGHWDEAYARLETAMQLAETNVSILDDTFIAIQLARLALLQGDLAHATQVIQAYELEQPKTEMYYYLWEYCQLVLLRAQTLALPSDPGPAPAVAEALSTLMADSERRERVTPTIEALILRAYALHAAGQRAEAAADLSRTLTLGAQGGYVRIFADEGKALLYLLQQYRPQIHVPHSYLDQILALLRSETTHHGLRAAQPSASTSQDFFPLTRRELDILTLLAAGKSNQEIAAERVLSLNTVKKHVANILGKLGVSNRTQAVTVARAQGWIP
ncbi:MAG: LuxR C-terminal-related transcriptional regulator [Chloroflexota bacterium]